MDTSLRKLFKQTFEDHKGRPGKVGGSLPRGSSNLFHGTNLKVIDSILENGLDINKAISESIVEDEKTIWTTSDLNLAQKHGRGFNRESGQYAIVVLKSEVSELSNHSFIGVYSFSESIPPEYIDRVDVYKFNSVMNPISEDKIVKTKYPKEAIRNSSEIYISVQFDDEDYKIIPLEAHKQLFTHGGPGSGFKGHAGRKGLVGGSKKSNIETVKQPTWPYEYKVDRSVLSGDPEDPNSQFVNGYSDLKDIPGIDPSYGSESEYVWRSMSAYELNKIRESGEIQSKGPMVFHDQGEMTFYSSNPSRMYAEDNFKAKVVARIQEVLPDFPEPKFGDHAYIVAVPKNLVPNRNRQGEFYTTSPISSSSIARVIAGRPAVKDSSGYSIFGWKDITDVWEIEKSRKLFKFGGPGSGFRGHHGRPGKVGGSSKGDRSLEDVLAEQDKTNEEEARKMEEFLKKPVDHRKRVEDVVKKLGYPAGQVISTEDEGYVFHVGNQTFRADGEYDPKTGRITVFDVDEKSNKTLEGILAHEVQHSRWQKYKDSFQGQFVEIQKSIRDNPHPDDWLIKADGSLRNPADKDRLWAYEIHEEFLSGDKWETLQKEDGVTSYSISYWDAVNPNSLYDRDRAVDETLAEIARIEMEIPLGKMQSVPDVWKDLYKRVRKYGS